jgi:energy-coupling factor transporter transmembrane protein EcfT
MKQNWFQGLFILICLIVIAVFMFIKPSYFRYLFNTFFGFLVLVALLIFSWFINKTWFLGLFAIIFIIYAAFHMGEKEGMVSNYQTDSESYSVYVASTWPQELIEQFIKYQQTINPNVRFDMNILQQQATPQEAQQLINNGKWPWSTNVQDIYKQAISQNSVLNISTLHSLEQAQTIYCQTAIEQLLSWNTKEGNFLLTGLTIGHSKRVPKNVNNVARCGLDYSGNMVLEKVIYKGYNGINGNLESKVQTIPNSEIPNVVNGFNFLNGECNPCVALQDPPNYTCPFSLNTGNGNAPSPIWSHLWGLDGCGNQVAGTSFTPETLSININFDSSQFPMLNDLKNEIDASSNSIDLSFKKPLSYNMIGVYSAENISAIGGVNPVNQNKKRKYDYNVVSNNSLN